MLTDFFNASKTKGPQFVLNIGDENVVLMYTVDGRAKNAWLAPSDPSKFEENLAEAFATDISAPVYVLLDVHEQLYRDETMPAYSSIDRAKIMHRHLSITFPGKGLRSYLQLDAVMDRRSSGGRVASELLKLIGMGSKIYNYLLIGIPMTEHIESWLQRMDNLPNPFGGIYLLPVESVSMMKRLMPAADKKKEGQHWQVLVGYNATGGIRQIISKNNYLVMTRMANMDMDHSSPAGCAAEIQRDFNATLSYIKRKGYKDTDMLDVVFITSEDIGKHFSPEKVASRTVTVMTPGQAGSLLNLGKVSTAGQPFCDMLHSVWFAAKKNKKLRLRRNEKGEIDLREHAEKYAPYVLSAVFAIVLLLTGASLVNMISLSGDIADTKKLVSEKASILVSKEEQRDKLPYSPARVKKVMELYKELNKGDNINIVEDLSAFAEALPEGFIVTNFASNMVEIDNNSLSGRRRRRPARRRNQEERVLRYTIAVKFPPDVVSPENALELSEDIKKSLAEVFDDSDVDIVRAPVDILPNQTLQGKADVSSQRQSSVSDFNAEFSVTRKPQ